MIAIQRDLIIDSNHVKATATELGADLCGIASIARFVDAPEGFHPCDVLPGCKTVIVLACQFLKSTLLAKSTIPYTSVRNELTRKMDQLAIRLSYHLEAGGETAISINPIGPCEWDAKTNKYRGIISLKHAAVLAGLGTIGKNTLLINDQYGNMIWLSAVVTTAVLEPDPLPDYTGCIDGCRLCLDACPVQAMDGVSMDQQKCWDYAFGPHNEGEWRIKCFTCRQICPRRFGMDTPTR